MEGWMLCILISCVTLQVEAAGIRVSSSQPIEGIIVRTVVRWRGGLGYMWNDVTGETGSKIFKTYPLVPESFQTTTKLSLSEFGSLHMANVSGWFEYQEIPDEQQLTPSIAFPLRSKYEGARENPVLSSKIEYVGNKDIYSLNAKFRLAEVAFDITNPELRDKYDAKKIVRSANYTHVITGITKGVFAELLMINSKQSLTSALDIELIAFLKAAAGEMNNAGKISEETRTRIFDATANFTFEMKSNINFLSVKSDSLFDILNWFENIPQILNSSYDSHYKDGVGMFFVLTPLKEFYQFIPADFPQPHPTVLRPVADTVRANLLALSQEFKRNRQQVQYTCDLFTVYSWFVWNRVTLNNYTSLCSPFESPESLIREEYFQAWTKIRCSLEDSQDISQEFFQFFRNSLYGEESLARFNGNVSRPINLIKAFLALDEAGVSRVKYSKTVNETIEVSGKYFVLYYDSRLFKYETYMDLFMENQEKLLEIKHHENATFLLKNCAHNNDNMYDKYDPTCTDKVNYIYITELGGSKVHINDSFAHQEKEIDRCGTIKMCKKYILWGLIVKDVPCDEQPTAHLCYNATDLTNGEGPPNTSFTTPGKFIWDLVVRVNDLGSHLG